MPSFDYMAFLGNEHFIQCLMLPGLCKSDITSTIMALSPLLITLLLVKNLNSSQNRCEMWAIKCNATIS